MLLSLLIEKFVDWISISQIRILFSKKQFSLYFILFNWKHSCRTYVFKCHQTFLGEEDFLILNLLIKYVHEQRHIILVVKVGSSPVTVIVIKAELERILCFLGIRFKVYEPRGRCFYRSTLTWLFVGSFCDCIISENRLIWYYLF